MCKQYIHSKFFDVSDRDITIYEDEGFSAKNTHRPQFQTMLQDIKLKKPDYVICYRLDRISRNVSDFSSLIEDLNQRNISFVCIKEEFNTSVPMGKAMMYIASVFAQLERETIAERVRDNMLMLARTGRWLGGTTPTGYTSEKQQEIIIDGRLKTSCRLKDNPAELKIIDTLFEKFLELHSISGVSKYLIKQGIKSRNGNFYSLLGIKEILQNPVYCIADKDAFEYFTTKNSDVCFEEKDCSNKYGILSYNKRDYKKKNAPRQSMDKWIIAIGKHKGRISGKKWIYVQNIIEANIPTGKKPSKMHNDYSLLSGLIYCDKCGNRMFAKQRSGKGANPDLFDYLCQSKMRGGLELCNSQNLCGQQTDNMVWEQLINSTSENSNIYKLLEKLKLDFKENLKVDPLTGIYEKIKKNDEEMCNLVNIISQGNIGSAFIQKINSRIAELDQELSGLNQEREQLQKNVNRTIHNEAQVNMIARELSSLKTNFNTLSVYEKRSLIKLLIKKIVWDESDLHIFIN